MKLLEMAKELIEIYQDMPNRQRSLNSTDFIVYNFDQLWNSTALGFDGVGGAALTWSRTYVLIPKEADHIAYVYFGSRFAYSCPTNTEAFWKDVKTSMMASVNDKHIYFKGEKI